MQTKSRAKRHNILRTAALFLVATMLGILGAGLDSAAKIPVARAAMSNGVGYQIEEKWIGSFKDQSTSKNLWCVELGIHEDLHNSYSNTIDAAALPAFHNGFLGVGAVSKTSSQYQRIAYLLSKYGATPASNDVGAALAMAIWNIRGEVGAAGTYMYFFQTYKDALQSRSPSAIGLYNSMLTEASAWWAAGGAVPGSTNPNANGVTIVATDAYSGTITVPAGAIEITLTNAVFSDSGSNKKTWSGRGLSTATTFVWNGRPPAGWARHYTVSAAGKYKSIKTHYVIPATLNFNGQIVAGDPGTGEEEKENNFTGKQIQVDTLWAPELLTNTATKFLQEGEKFSDSVTFYAAEGGVYAKWRQDPRNARFAPIKATGVLYGPFDSDPALAPSAFVPEGAPVAGSASVTTTETRGPGTYEVETNITAQGAGYYTWVWSIDFAEQSSAVKSPSGGQPALPVNYRFSDRFGEATEGQTVPMRFEISTQIDRDVVRQPGREFHDLVTLDVINGNWMNAQNSAPAPVKVRLHAYGLNDPPTQQSSAPAEAVVVAQGFATVTAEGVVTESEPLKISQDSYDRFETLTVQACVFKEDQTAEVKNLVTEICDDWGVPSETAEIEWLPELTTSVESKFIDVGDELNDTVTFFVSGLSVAESAEYGWRKFPNRNTYLPVKAEGTLYGPFDYDPALTPSQEVPAWARGRVAATASITTSSVLGPGTYELRMPKAKEAGYYTWVWEIKNDAQIDATVKRTIPENYHFSDGFGTFGESLITSSSLRISTNLNKSQVLLDDRSVTDAVNVSLYDGQWLLDESGSRVPATVRLTAYGVIGEIQRHANPPEESVEIQRGFVQVTEQDKDFISESLAINLVDFISYDAITIQACILKEDQPEELQGFIKEACDEWGLPKESAVFVKPEVTTQATEHAAVKSDIKDSASVIGLPEGVEAELHFTAYLKPEAGKPKYDSEWKVLTEEDGSPILWDELEISNLDSVCEAQPVAKTEPLLINASGEYDSHPVRAESEGTVYWVEELLIEDKEEGLGEKYLLHRGECGLPNETTLVKDPRVTTQAKETAKLGAKVFDTALVEGDLSERTEVGYALTFEAFLVGEGGVPTRPDEALCTPETKVWESAETIPVSGPGEYRSDSFRVKEEHVGHILWVETLWEIEQTGEGEIKRKISVGKCGEKTEITTVIDEKLVTTGAVFSATGMLLGLGMVISGIALSAKRRKETV